MLRDYQLEAIREVYRHFQAGRNKVVMRLPTGTGKTVTAGFKMMKLNEKLGWKSLVLVHRIELVYQFQKTLQDFGIEASLIVAKDKKAFKADAPVQIAMLQTLNRRNIDLDPDLIVVDECHHAVANSYYKSLDKYPNAKVLGLTATPLRLDGKGMGRVFDAMVQTNSYQWFAENHFLAFLRVIAPPVAMVDTTGIATKAGDFNQTAMAERVTDVVIADIVKSYIKHGENRFGIVFCISLEQSKDVARRFNEAGISAAHIDGKTKVGEREYLLKKFKEGKIKILTNVDIISEGFDCPSCDLIILARPTKSLSLYLQQVGRCTRMADKKLDGLVLDLANCCAIHNLLPDEEVNWSLADAEKGAKETEPTLYHCKKCFYYYSMVKKRCPVCKTERPVSKQERFLIEQEMVLEVKSRTTRSEFYEYAMARAKEIGLNRRELSALAKHCGYSNGWAYHTYNALLTQAKANRNGY